MFAWYHWLIIVVPVLAVCYVSLHCRRYVRSVSDFLVAGRCAGRYVLLSGGMMGGLSVVSIIGGAEVHYNNGWAYTFWNNLLVPLGLMMSLYGWISYRFRETRAMSAGQFFEMRYSRGVRHLAAILRGSADLLANSIGPAVAVRFLIYLLGLPFRFTLFGHEFHTFPFLLSACLALAILMILAGGRISLLVTDSIQGLIAYPIFVVLVIFVLTRFSFWDEIAPVLGDRVPGESFINPYDIKNLRDFNFFGLIVALMHRLLGGAWIGNGYGTVARSAHESKMSGIVGFFGSGMSGQVPVVLAMVVLAVMCHANHAETATEVRRDLSARVVEELVEERNEDAAAAVRDAVAAVPAQRHVIGVDAPLSQKNNLETPTLEAAHGALLATLPETEANAAYQGFRTTYRQQTLPLVLRHVAPAWILSLLVLLVLLLVVSTDDTRIFDTTTTWMQDFILPFFRNPPSPRFHLAMFKGLAIAIGVLFWCGSSFFAQLDYISMFVTIFTSLWVAGAGAVVTLGLYWRRGTTAGAYAAIISGGGISLAAILIQRNWASAVYPWLAAHGWEAGVRHLLEVASSPFVPWIDWRVTDALWPVKFPVNSIEISFIAGMTAFLLYVVISLLTCKEPFDLDAMLHRKHSVEVEKKSVPEAARHCRRGGSTFAKRLLNSLVGITPEFTREDRIIAWLGFFKHMVWEWIVAFLLCSIAARIFHWGVREWAIRCFVVVLVVPITINVVTTVWFTWGTIRDLKRLFHDLAERRRNDLDNGMVEGHVSLADKARE
jgi:Na+/proline symporter